MNALIKSCKQIIKDFDANVIYVVTNDLDFVKKVIKTFKNIKLIVATNNKAIIDEITDKDIIFKRLWKNYQS